MISELLNRINYKLLVLFCFLSAVVLLRSYFDTNGGITPDSTRYLQLSENLLAGKGFQVINYVSPEGKALFSIWPVGYPILIFIVSKLTGLSVFWASKFLSVLVMGFCLYLFQIIFRQNAHWAGMIFFANSVLAVNTYTWSEGTFLLFCLIFCISIFQFVKSSGKTIWLIAVFFSGLALFITRYIGCFSIMVVGLIFIIHVFRRKWLVSIKLLFIAILQSLTVGLYLYNNKLATGYLTGAQRQSSEEVHRELLRPLFSALNEELNLFNISPSWVSIAGTIILFLLLGFYLFRNKNIEFRNGTMNDIWKYLMLTSLVYFISITIMVWISNVEDLNYRYLVPSTFLFILSIAAYLNGKPKIRLMERTLLSLAIISICGIHYIPHKYTIYKHIITKGNYDFPNYPDNMHEMENKYQVLEPNSIVIFGSDHLRYLKDDVIPTDIYTKSTFDNIISNLKGRGEWNIYIEIHDDLDPERYHQSVLDFTNSQSDVQLVKIE